MPTMEGFAMLSAMGHAPDEDKLWYTSPFYDVGCNKTNWNVHEDVHEVSNAIV